MSSKHSQYQVMPPALIPLIPEGEISVKSRYEHERMTALKQWLDFRNKRVMDIGGNTGFFSFESIAAGACEVLYVEGNKAHADFVLEASGLTNTPIRVRNAYFDFEELGTNLLIDIVLLFNVIHHLGDDYGDSQISLERAKEKMADCINFFQGRTQTLVLQMGFCWKGDRNKLLFEHGTKTEMTEFVKKATEGKWSVQAILVPEREKGSIIYRKLNEYNVQRNDDLGEFLNRPIFILESL
jgi:2-polyprenyl-3-methyl-5-hydroxy-6-metoxy-1,4-benzoquinol methylase